MDLSREIYKPIAFRSKDATGRLAVILKLLGRKTRHLISKTEDSAKQARRARDSAMQLANFDPLTNLANRRYFYSFLEQKLETNDGSLYLMFIDLDNFKEVNDYLGHDFGDELLKVISKRLSTLVRSSDLVARLGGDEFAILLECPKNHIDDFANRILREASSPIKMNEFKVQVSASIGLTTIDKNSNTSTKVVKQADLAMYHAKQLGRNNFQHFTLDLEEKISKRQGLLYEIRKGIKLGQFVLYYQPRVSLVDFKVLGAEALVRWQHPEKGLIMPGEFIPIVEESDLIFELGEQLLQICCRDIASLIESGDGLPISLNISTRQFYRDGFFNHVSSVLEESGIDPAYLELEITETILMENLETAKNTIQLFRSLGLRTSIDDFGTGHSSMSYLSELPVEAMKIDKRFLEKLDKRNKSIVQAINSLGRCMDLEVIAEGVDSLEKVKFLQDIHCDSAQGYHFSKPISLEDFQEYLQAQHNVIRLQTG